MSRVFTLRLEGRDYEIEQRGKTILVNGKPFEPEFSADGVTIGKSSHKIEIVGASAFVDGIAYSFETEGLEREKRRGPTGLGKSSADVDGALTAIMPGLIIKVLVSQGDQVSAGDVVVILEAMKMENEICSPKDGTVKEVRVKEGESVAQSQVLAVIE